jgi:hypothetical protein
MRPSTILRMHSARLTLFTRPNCSLCETAKSQVALARRNRGIVVDYREIDVMAAGQQAWRQLYEFDTPVLHVQRVTHTYAKPDVVSDPSELMHRFVADEVERLVDEAEAGLL